MVTGAVGDYRGDAQLRWLLVIGLAGAFTHAYSCFHYKFTFQICDFHKIHMHYFLIGLTFHVNCLLSRQFTWSTMHNFLRNIIFFFFFRNSSARILLSAFRINWSRPCTFRKQACTVFILIIVITSYHTCPKIWKKSILLPVDVSKIVLDEWQTV